MKKLLSVILTLTLILSALPLGLFSITASAATDGYYTYSVSNGEATITDVDSRISDDVTIPSTLGGYPVTSIGESAFQNCTGLTSITIPDSVTSIGDAAFAQCVVLTSIDIPNSITSIGDFAFYECYNLQYNAYGDGVYLGNQSNPYLYLARVTSRDITEFYFASGVRFISEYAFEGCTGLTSIDIPNGVTSIGDYAFYCTSLASVTIPDSVTTIGYEAFSKCTNLASIDIPDSVIQIGHMAFGGCESLQEITIGKGVSSIGTVAFYSSNPQVVNYNAVNCVFVDMLYDSPFSGCNISNLNIGEDVVTIPAYLFSNSKGYNTVTIPDSVCEIGDNAFSFCEDISTVELGAGVTSIGDDAFGYCNDLKNVFYAGSFSAKEDISIGNGNDALLNANWVFGCEEHSLTLNGGHTCSVCRYSQTPTAPLLSSKTETTVILVQTEGMEYSIDKITWQKSNVFTNLTPGNTYFFYQRIAETDVARKSAKSDNLTVTMPKFTAETPVAPTVSNKTETSITLTAVSGMEYSKDGTTWQSSNVFTGLLPNTTYTFYQRVAETATCNVSEKSNGTTVKTNKVSVAAPAAPTLASKTDTTVTLTAVNGMEYSKDGTTWQANNVFTGLAPKTAYIFYQRVAETDTYSASEKSAGLSVTTNRGTHATPSAPTFISSTTSQVTLLAIEGMEYSKNGTTWQKSNVFSGLVLGEEYTFYQRVAETDSYYASESSPPLTVVVKKSECSIIPVKPIIADYTSNSVTLYNIPGYEYSKNGTTWQSSNVFSGLSTETKYTFYQRIKETETEEASAATSITQTTPGISLNSDVAYEVLKAYIKENANTQVDYDPAITEIIQNDSKQTTSLTVVSEWDCIRFMVLIKDKKSTRLDLFVQFELKKSNKTTPVGYTMAWYSNNIQVDSVIGIGNIDRSKHTDKERYNITPIGNSISASDFAEGFNLSFSVLCISADLFTSDAIGVGLQGLGFVSYDGIGETLCDPATAYHAGKTEKRGARAAGCVIDGNTGHTYCKTCQQKLSSGTVIESVGHHTYSAECDADCDKCSEERKVEHTYSADCDKSCNVCSSIRTVSSDHVFDDENDKECNRCGESPYTPGDLTGDDKINSLDGLMLMRYLNGWENLNIASPEAMDVNADGKVNSLDGLLLMRYLNGWNVQLG